MEGRAAGPRDACADGAQHRRSPCAPRAARESGFLQAGAKGLQDFALGSGQPNFVRIGRPRFERRQDLASPSASHADSPRTATVDSEKASHRAFHHQRPTRSWVYG